MRAQDEPGHVDHVAEQEDAWTAQDVADFLNGWDHEAELGPCPAHGIRRCTICLGEQGR